MLQVRGLEMSGAPWLAGVSLSAWPGEVVALVGPRGSGKTTLLRAIAGLASPSAGSIDWRGERIDGLGPAAVARRGVRLVPASGAIVSGLSVAQNLRLGGIRLRGRAWRRELEWVTGLFPGLGARLAEPAGELGAAERRILVIGRALLARPRLLLVDGARPGGVPPGVGAQLLELVSALAGKGLAVVVADRRADCVPIAGRRVELAGRVASGGAVDRPGFDEIDLADLSAPAGLESSGVEPGRSTRDGGSR